MMRGDDHLHMYNSRRGNVFACCVSIVASYITVVNPEASVNYDMYTNRVDITNHTSPIVSPKEGGFNGTSKCR
jgi:hypothetical protein